MRFKLRNDTMNKLKLLLGNEKIKKIIKFGITGGLNTLVDFAVYTLVLWINPNVMYLAQTLGYSAGIVNSYTINRKWTFKTNTKYVGKELVQFILLNLAMLGVSFVCLYLFTTWLSCGKIVAKLFTTAITMVISFLVNNFLIFKE